MTIRNLTLTFCCFTASAVAAVVVAAEPASSGSPLFQAIRAGDSAAVQRLLKDGADLGARNDVGDTPLMSAAWQGNTETLELLLQAGADVNATSKTGATALLRAASFEDKVRRLVAKGANVNARSALGNTALILGARTAGNSGTVKYLLDRGADPNAASGVGTTALMSAAAAGDIDSVRLLLDKGADVNARPNMNGNGFLWGGGRTALMWAAFEGHESLAKLLLERGAKVNEFTLAGSALTQAGWGGHAGVARLLLDAGAQVDQRDLVANYTPLHWAASSERSSPALVELLLARGANANAAGGERIDNYLGVPQTPLMLARRRGDTPIVTALLKAGAQDPPAEVPDRRSVVRAASGAGAEPVVQVIHRALPSLTRTAEESLSVFLRHVSKQDCISCHQQQLPLAALSLAHSRRFPTDRQATRHQLELLKRSFSTGHVRLGDQQHSLLEIGLQTTFHPEPVIAAGYNALALRGEGEPASELTDSLVHQVAALQQGDGRWIWNLPRPPIQASDITTTAQGVYTIQTYGIPARRRELDARVQRAQAWLNKTQAETNEERVHQLLGLAWAGEQSGTLKSFADDLVRQQRADGGWGQLAGLPSDAYATGQALYALLEGAKLSADNPVVRRGVDFLRQTQLADGTWHVRRRAHPFQPPMDSGFPHGADGWISAAGTSWALMALTTSLDASQTPAPASAIAKATATAPPVAASSAPVEFVRDIQPLFERSCLACHGGKQPKGGFRVTDRASLLKGGNRGEPAVVPGKPGESPLLSFVQDQEQDLEMPPLSKRSKFPALTKDEIAKLSAWIAARANWPQGVTLEPPGK